MPRQQRTSVPFCAVLLFCCARFSLFSERSACRNERRQVCKEISLRHFQLSTTKWRIPKTAVIMSSTKFWIKTTVWQSVCLTVIIGAYKRTKFPIFSFIKCNCPVNRNLANYFLRGFLLSYSHFGVFRWRTLNLPCFPEALLDSVTNLTSSVKPLFTLLLLSLT